MAADPVNKPKSGPIVPIDLTEEELEREAESLRNRLDEVTERLQRAIGERGPRTITPPMGTGVFRPRRVLVIEDEPDGRETLSGLISRLGHEVRTAANGLDGLLMLQAFHPDVAMVDLAMPGLDGYTVARRIKQALGNEAPRLIAYTGYEGAAIRSAAIAAGFDHHVLTPIPIDQLMSLLQPRAALAPT